MNTQYNPNNAQQGGGQPCPPAYQQQPVYQPPRLCCPRCRSPYISVQPVTEYNPNVYADQFSYGMKIFGAVMCALTIVLIPVCVLLCRSISKQREISYTRTSTVAVCQSCGFSWRVQ